MHALAIIFAALASAAGLLAALFRFIGSAQTKQQQAAWQAWCRSKWASLSSTRWFQLPEAVIIQAAFRITAAVSCLTRWVRDVEHPGKPFLPWGLYNLASVGVFLVLFNLYFMNHRDQPDAIRSALTIVGLGVSTSLGSACIGLILRKLAPGLAFAETFFGHGVYLGGFGPIIALGLTSALELPLWLSPLLIVAGAPFLVLGFGIVSSGQLTGYFLPQRSVYYGLAITFSIFLTSASLLLGHISQPHAYVPLTFQMISSKLIFDTLTIVATAVVLKKASGRGRRINIPIAVGADLAIAAIAACFSLQLGLAFTEQAISLGQVRNVLVGRSLDGVRWELGPYFFVMHTTFMPVLSYLGVLLVCWNAKAFLLGVSWLLAKGQHPDVNPLNLTAAFLGVVAAFGAALAFWVEHLSR